MKKLIIIEWHKIWPYRTFRVMMLLFFVTAMLLFFLPNALNINGIDLLSAEVLSFPDVWPNVTYMLAHFFNLIPAIIVIFLIANEFSYRTIRQNVIDGLSRKEIILAKALMIFLISLGCTVFVVFLGITLGLVNTNMSVLSNAELFENTSFILGYFVSTFAVLSFAAFLAFILKRTGLTVIVFLLYITIIESILRSRMEDQMAQFMPSKAIFNVVKFPYREMISEAMGMGVQQTALEWSMLIAACYAVVFISLSYVLIRNKDI